jgi:hypothetical protein
MAKPIGWPSDNVLLHLCSECPCVAGMINIKPGDPAEQESVLGLGNTGAVIMRRPSPSSTRYRPRQEARTLSKGSQRASSRLDRGSFTWRGPLNEGPVITTGFDDGVDSGRHLGSDSSEHVAPEIGIPCNSRASDRCRQIAQTHKGQSRGRRVEPGTSPIGNRQKELLSYCSLQGCACYYRHRLRKISSSTGNNGELISIVVHHNKLH